MRRVSDGVRGAMGHGPGAAARPRIISGCKPRQTGGAAPPPISASPCTLHTFQRREASAQDQLQIAQLPLAENDGLELLCLVVKLLASGRITRNQVLEDAACCSSALHPCACGRCEHTMGRVGHVE